MVNQHFSQQILKAGSSAQFGEEDPFDNAGLEVAHSGYVYKRWPLSGELDVVCRCDVDALTEVRGADVFCTVKAVHEFEPRISGMDWRRKLETQRGAVLATELKNNGNKMARWTLGALLVGSEVIRLGYVSRTSMRDRTKHVILGVQQHKPKDLAMQMDLRVNNSWGILKAIAECLQGLDDGRYVLLRDPNKNILRIHKVPNSITLYDLGGGNEA